jgi:predicted amidophosphoribosyltransferase
MGVIKRKHISSPLAGQCPHCHERVPVGARQCTTCGRSLADVSSEAERERRSDAQGR